MPNNIKRDFSNLQLDGLAHDRAQKYLDAITAKLEENSREFHETGHEAVYMKQVEPTLYSAWTDNREANLEPLTQVVADVRVLIGDKLPRIAIHSDGGLLAIVLQVKS